MNNTPLPPTLDPENAEFLPLDKFFAGSLIWLDPGRKVLAHRVQIFASESLEMARQTAIEAIQPAFLSDPLRDDLPTIAQIVIIPINTYILAMIKGEKFYEDQPVTEINLTALLTDHRGQ